MLSPLMTREAQLGDGGVSADKCLYRALASALARGGDVSPVELLLGSAGTTHSTARAPLYYLPRSHSVKTNFPHSPNLSRSRGRARPGP